MDGKKLGDFRISETQLLILKIIGGTALFAAVMVMPGLAILGRYLPSDKNFKQRKWHIENKVLAKMRDNSLIYYYKKGGKEYIGLTGKGSKVLEERRLQVEARLINKKKERWDKKWRVIIFDIPEKKAQKRNSLRLALKEYGFVPVQKSVWIYPHKCDELIELLKVDFRLREEIILLEVSKIEGEQLFKKEFPAI